MTQKRNSAGGKKPTAASKKGKKKRPDVNVFIAEYKIDHNGRRAAIAAGYAPGSAAVTACRLLTKANVRSEIESQAAEAIAKVQHDTGITLERTLREIARISFFDPRRMFAPDGRPLEVTELDDDTAAAIAGLDVLEQYEGSGEARTMVGLVKKWKLADKKGGLDMLMKHLGGYKVDHDQSKPELAAQLADFIGQIHESGAGRLPIAKQKAKP